jgi:phosphopantothenoylcysteine decarboxylase/phosphopantothenate--cysteine ligase
MHTANHAFNYSLLGRLVFELNAALIDACDQVRTKQALADALRSEWEPVPDLLAGLVQRRPPAQAILGFAAQSGEVLQEARAKFARKGCDLLFANPIDRSGAGFAAASNEGWLLGPGQRQRHFGPTGKLSLAHELLTALAEVMALRAPVRATADP